MPRKTRKRIFSREPVQKRRARLQFHREYMRQYRATATRKQTDSKRQNLHLKCNMDLRTVQQQLKANISRHQVLMVQIKNNPQDETLKTSLQEVQKQIAQLGIMQKNLGAKKNQISSGKQQGSSNGNGVDCIPPSAQSNMVKDESAVHKNCGFVKLSSSGAPLRNSTLAIPTNMVVNSSNAGGSIDSVSMAKSREQSLSVSFGANSSAIVGGFEPLNLTKCSTSHSLSPMPVINSTFQNVVASPPPKQVIQPATQKRVPTANPLKVPPPTHLKTLPSTALIRLPCKKLPPLAPVRSQSHILLNVSSASSGMPKSSLIHPVTHLPGDIGKKTTTTFQNFRIVGANITGMKPALQLSKTLPPDAIIPSSSAIQRSLSAPMSNSPSKSNPVPDAGSAIPKPTFSPEAKTIRPCPLPSDQSNQKVSFLGRLNLVPLDKAEKMRNRRYGRRRAVAHPVYSGGLYVSMAGGDSSKRVFPSELLDFGLETIPAKRPRGRPKGSTNKRGPSPSQLSNQVNEEYYRILQCAKPSDIPTTQQEKVDDLCEVCKKPGEFLMCDTCSRLFHMTCLSPPLNTVPTGMWYCKTCKDKIQDCNSAPQWPGILSIVHSFFAFNTGREKALAKARESARILKFKKCKLIEEKKLLAGILKEKVINKVKEMKKHEDSMNTCEKMTALLERIRCAINKSIDAS